MQIYQSFDVYDQVYLLHFEIAIFPWTHEW